MAAEVIGLLLLGDDVQKRNLWGVVWVVQREAEAKDMKS
jgi:hypothetical protein